MPPSRQYRAWNSLNQEIEACVHCPRLSDHCRKVAREKRKAFIDWDYWGKPVPNFGASQANLLIVGLAPAAHGANRTGRMFTGDRSGDWLYAALHDAGFANDATSVSANDGLTLIDCAITAACHCAPPANRPTRDELLACQQWLDSTIDLLTPKVLLGLGQIGWKSALDAARLRGWQAGKLPKFAHGAVAPLTDRRWLVASYHPSQQNTFTGKLTPPMFRKVITTASELLEPS